jgi:hypothetical protein
MWAHTAFVFYIVYVLSTAAFVVFQTVATVNIRKFLKDSAYLMVYYMPEDRFKRIRKYFILSLVPLIIQYVFSPYKQSWIEITLLCFASVFIGYFWGMLNSLNKGKRWTKKNSPGRFVWVFTLTVVFLTIYTAYGFCQYVMFRKSLGL